MRGEEKVMYYCTWVHFLDLIIKTKATLSNLGEGQKWKYLMLKNRDYQG